MVIRVNGVELFEKLKLLFLDLFSCQVNLLIRIHVLLPWFGVD